MIGVPGAYFRAMATQDYANYRSALAREFLQNSVDARAKNISFNLDINDRTLVVTDDGLGMDEDILLNKLLVLGGTHKLEGSVGGFGKAKELLFFSWEKYEIRTRDLLVQGAGAHFTVDKQPDYVAGTQVKLWFPDAEDLWWLQHNMKKQLESNQVDAKVMFNNEEVPNLRRGRLVQELDYTPENSEARPFAKVHLNKSAEDSRTYIRLRGITMFCKELWANRKGQIVIELQGESVELFTSNRDGLKYEAQRKLDDVINELLSNCNTALKEKSLYIDKYAGEGQIAVKCPDIKKHRQSVEKAVSSTKEYVGNATSSKEISDIIQSNNRVKYFFQNNTNKLEQLSKCDNLEKAKQEVEKALKALHYNPDFIVKRKDKLPKSLDPATWSKANLKLAIIWENVVKQVLFNAGKDLKFSIGWTTDDIEIHSELYTLEDDSKAFLLNPGSPYLMSRNFVFLVNELVDLAIREVTRLDHSRYNESFFEAYQSLRRECRMTDFGGIIKEALKTV